MAAWFVSSANHEPGKRSSGPDSSLHALAGQSRHGAELLRSVMIGSSTVLASTQNERPYRMSSAVSLLPPKCPASLGDDRGQVHLPAPTGAGVGHFQIDLAAGRLQIQGGVLDFHLPFRGSARHPMEARASRLDAQGLGKPERETPSGLVDVFTDDADCEG